MEHVLCGLVACGIVDCHTFDAENTSKAHVVISTLWANLLPGDHFG